MAITKLKKGYDAIKYVLTKVLTKKGVKGIATIPGKAYDMRMKQLVDEMAFKMKALGYDINKVTQKDVQGLLDSAEALAKQKKPTIESLLKGEKYTDERGRVWDFGTKDRPFPGWKPKIVKDKTLLKDSPEQIAKIKAENKAAVKRLQDKKKDRLATADELEDAREIVDPSGEAYMVEEGMTVKELDKMVAEQKAYEAAMYRDYKAGKLDPTPGDKSPARKRFLEKKLEEMELSGDKRLMTREEIEELSSFDLGTEMDEAIKKSKTLTPEDQLRTEFPGIDDRMIKNILADKNPQRIAEVKQTMREYLKLREVGKSEQEAYDIITKAIKKPTKHADGGRIGMMYGGDPGFAFEYGGSWADWHDQHRDQMPVEQYIKTKLPKHRLPFRELQSGGLAYMLGEPTYMKYGAGGSVGHAPWHKPTGQQQPPAPMDTPTPNVTGTPDPLKAPRGLPSVAPRNMDPAYMQQQMMQQAMMGQGPRPMAAEGGIMRAAFKNGGDMSRRGFMKLIAGIAALPVIGKYFKAAKLAKPAAAVTETIVKSNAAGMPAWFPSLVKRVIKEGDDVTGKAATIERQTVHSTKLPESGTELTVTRDLTTDDIIVDIGFGKHGWAAGRHGQPTRLVLKKGEWIEPDVTKAGKVKGKGQKTQDEFYVEEAEFTGGHPENVKFEDVSIENYGDHASDFTEIEKFAVGKNTDKKIIGKKARSDAEAEGRVEAEADDFAQGGLAYLLGE